MITTGSLHGHKAIWLENGALRLAVLPEKGADIPLFYYQPQDVQFLMQSQAGLRPPTGSPPTDFLENYEGGWQELFPNANDACEISGKALPFHGEVALLPWEYEAEAENDLHLWVDCRQLPFRLERRMRLRGNVLELESCVTNRGERAWPFVWGHHIVLGGNFLEDGCRLELPCETIITPDEIYEPATAILAEGQRETWPFARGRKPGERIDLRHVPGPQAHSHDDVVLTGLKSGDLKVTNPRLGLCFRIEWEAAVYPWVMQWRPLGGADLPPLTGIYGLGVEPWSSRYNLSQAVANGEAGQLEPGKSLTANWSITIEQV